MHRFQRKTFDGVKLGTTECPIFKFWLLNNVLVSLFLSKIEKSLRQPNTGDVNEFFTNELSSLHSICMQLSRSHICIKEKNYVQRNIWMVVRSWNAHRWHVSSIFFCFFLSKKKCLFSSLLLLVGGLCIWCLRFLSVINIIFFCFALWFFSHRRTYFSVHFLAYMRSKYYIYFWSFLFVCQPKTCIAWIRCTLNYPLRKFFYTQKNKRIMLF